MKKMFKVTVWNEEIQRTYNILAETKKEAINKAINNEMEVYHIPFYRIHIDKVSKA